MMEQLAYKAAIGMTIGNGYKIVCVLNNSKFY